MRHDDKITFDEAKKYSKLNYGKLFTIMTENRNDETNLNVDYFSFILI